MPSFPAEWTTLHTQRTHNVSCFFVQSTGVGGREPPPAMEVLLVRMDHIRDRATYVSILHEWLAELRITNARVIRMGTDVHLLFVAASEAQNSQLLQFFSVRAIDTNSRGELCIDKFIDVLGRKKVQKSVSCNGVTDMNVLRSDGCIAWCQNPTMLRKVLVQEWHAENEWVDTVLASSRTKAFLAWKQTAKAARKERRKKEGEAKHREREVKRLQREQQAAKDEREEEAKDEASSNVQNDKPTNVGNVGEKRKDTSSPVAGGATRRGAKATASGAEALHINKKRRSKP
ncbi:hypothetical protein PsorP6_014612 [Peronosclerospora sorghi]|uniref:Uncharacterized protein n=1 Tax=Peronosclerospora sorghi TaxID=230839 RepID=A0ACC0VTA9_9STRA|nr:hypothetical protein PsorP6_014612 [Peronosclerospora sorghi]